LSLAVFSIITRTAQILMTQLFLYRYFYVIMKLVMRSHTNTWWVCLITCNIMHWLL